MIEKEVLRNHVLPDGFGKALVGALDKLHGRHGAVLLNEHGLAHTFATLCLKDKATGHRPRFVSATRDPSFAIVAND